jgi:hypothetical protein
VILLACHIAKDDDDDDDDDDVKKESYCRALECVLHQFHGHHMKILLGDFNAEVEMNMKTF